MVLYKFKGTENFEHVRDIMENERLFCAKYEDLNDPFEAILGFSPPTPEGVPDIKFLHNLSKEWEKHLAPLSSYRICSLSREIENILMWSHYAVGFQGVCFEIDVQNYDNNIYDVDYVKDVSSLSISSPIDYLTKKLKCWEYESESRIISNESYFDVTGRIKRVYLGGRMNNDHTREISDYCLKKGWELSVVQPKSNGTLRFV